jgi:LPXTG-site transpeptidase (sortase) family protein
LLAALMAVAITSTAAPAYAHSAGVAPAVIDIPSIGTHADIVPLGEDEDGTMQSPADPDTVGWYNLGTGIGTPGNALLDGHVDWGGRLRVFGLLRQLRPGDPIQITDTNGNVLTYSVTWTRLYDARSAPLDQIFEQTADEQVTLITCGGTFDQAAHMYVSRVVVRATRAEPSAD